MTLYRGVVLVLCASCASSSLASFDLMMVREGSKVHRIDPVNGAYLGSFNCTFGAFGGMTASYNQKKLFVIGSTGSSLFAYNYSTGDELFSQNTSFLRCLTMSQDQSTVLAGTNNSIQRLDASTGMLLSNFATGTGDVQNLMVAPDGRLLTIELTAGNHYARTYSSAGVLLSSATIESSTATYGTGMALNGSNLFFPLATGTPNYGFASYNSATGIASSAFAVGSTGRHTSLTSVVPGHNGAYFVGVDVTAANGLNITRVDSAGYWGYKYTYASITSPSAVAIVLAPEPASFAVLALGGFALLRRRRR